MQAPVTVLQTNTKRESGRKAQLGNIMAGKAVADIVRTTLGPRAMLKMLLDANGSIVLTNDGNAILREIDVSHPAAKSIIDLSRTQDQEVGDGTTSVIILAGEMLGVAEPFLERNLHPTVIIRGYLNALKDAEKIFNELSFPVDVDDDAQMMNIVTSCIGTKFTQRFGDLIAGLAIQAVRCVMTRLPNGTPEIDIKKYAKVEKIPGCDIEDSKVLKGVMFEKDVVVPARMRRKIENPRILLMDCPLEYKKGENQAQVELSKEEDFAALLKAEEDWIKRVCDTIASFKPDVVITEKGLSDLAAHYLTKSGISAIRRLRKTDNNRIARACGATIVNRPDEIKESDIGTGAGLFEVSKIGDDFYTFITECKDPKACSIILRGASRDVLHEVERNLHDALGVTRNIMIDPRLVPGGGAVEMAVSRGLAARANSGDVSGTEVGPYMAVGQALEVIPRTLAQNCGANVIRTLTKLRAEHAEHHSNVGIDGTTGQVVDMKELGVWDPYAVRLQTLNTAVECACLLLRIDDILSGLKKKDKLGPGQKAPQVDSGDNVDSEHALPE
jgi:T-complex protein 1 subunit gamma